GPFCGRPRSDRINDKGETENNPPVSFPRPGWTRLNRHYERAVDTVRILAVGVPRYIRLGPRSSPFDVTAGFSMTHHGGGGDCLCDKCTEERKRKFRSGLLLNALKKHPGFRALVREELRLLRTLCVAMVLDLWQGHDPRDNLA